MAEDAVQKYLTDIGEIYRTGGGVAEESYYGALEALLNEAGKALKPRVRCVGQLKDTGAGTPDFGFFTANQFQSSKDSRPIEGQNPERGVIECKPWKDDSFARTDSSQVSKYWDKYGLVLVTNFRDFVLVGRSEDGKPVRLESYRMAESESKFCEILEHPQKAAKEQGGRFVEFLRRAMLHAAPLTEPEDLAWFLASYAREAKGRVEQSANLPALEGLKNALEEALGMKFEGEKGEHFFQATLVQTLFYGVFSSWVLWSREHGGQPDAKFNWHDAAWTLHVPMITSLFDQIATPKRLKPLGIDEVLDWAGMVLNRVDRASFFSKFEQENAVQYFYEPFLKAYDPELRKDLGVWYTPPEIVKYQVERIDRVLREELNITDGLADEQVVVLDPCCGTGAYLVEVLKRIHKTLAEKGASALTAQGVKEAARKRVFGFEILPAPFVISHLQIGLLLRTIGAPLNAEGSERAGVYLTNALTGWEPLEDPKTLLPFPELKEERDKANKVKQESPILVILGNPPYNAFAGTSPEEEGDLVELYKGAYDVKIPLKRDKEKIIRKYQLSDPVQDGGWGIKKYNLDELYVRFFRIAERRIVKSGKGIVSYISNFSYLGDPSFVVMRNKFMEGFDKIWIDCMNGDSRETGKMTPEGKPDPSVFSTEQTSVGIRVGTAICVLVRKEKRDKKPRVLFQHYWGTNKKEDLLESLKAKDFDRRYKAANPEKSNKLSFRPANVSEDYLGWVKLADLCQLKPFPAFMESRKGALIDFDKAKLTEKMKSYFNNSVSWDEFSHRYSEVCESNKTYDAKKIRTTLLKTNSYKENNLKKYFLHPFDIRWCYHEVKTPLWHRSRPELSQQFWDDNIHLVSRLKTEKEAKGSPLIITKIMADCQSLARNVSIAPLYYKIQKKKSKDDDEMTANFLGDRGRKEEVRANLSNNARTYLENLGLRDPDKEKNVAEFLWMHCLAIGYSSAYLEENADGIRQDWPRIPLPKTKKVLLESAELGRQVAALLDTESPVEGVTTGKIDSRLKSIGVITRVEGGAIRPDKGELDLTAGWGHAGKGGVCMPGAGKYEERKQEDAELKKTFGDETLDIYLNGAAYWENVPKCVWEYYIGGYQVIKKRLSYREKGMLGRGLKVEEAEYVTEMARRLSALIMLQEKLNTNYETVKSDTWVWPRTIT